MHRRCRSAWRTTLRIVAQVVFSGVSFTYPGFATPVIRGLDLHIADGEFVSVLGPSGAGKSTLLRLLTGIEKPGNGRILIGGHDVTHLAAGERDVGSVSSNQALYAHLTVAQNIGFAMSIGSVPQSIIDARVADVVGALGLGRLSTRLPAGLTAPERQAVFLARALVRPVGVLVLDEPLKHLDHDDRRQARLQLSRLQRRTSTTTVYVTQDFTEAMTLSDRVAVVVEGQLCQLDEPLAVYDNPVSLPVARYFGDPPMNTLTAVRTDDGVLVGDLLIPLPGRLELSQGQSIVVGIRAEALHLLPRGARLRVIGIESTGTDAYVRGQLVNDPAAQQLVLRCPMRAAPRVGDTLHVDVLDDDRVLFFDPVTGRRR